MDKKYIVADGVSLTFKGIIYKSGAAVPAELGADSLAVLAKAKKIIEANGKAAEAKPEVAAAKGDDKGGKK